jgi:hypothetical protein
MEQSIEICSTLGFYKNCLPEKKVQISCVCRHAYLDFFFTGPPRFHSTLAVHIAPIYIPSFADNHPPPIVPSIALLSSHRQLQLLCCLGCRCPLPLLPSIAISPLPSFVIVTDAHLALPPIVALQHWCWHWCWCWY